MFHKKHDKRVADVDIEQNRQVPNSGKKKSW